jgi:hypothetical protein
VIHLADAMILGFEELMMSQPPPIPMDYQGWTPPPRRGWPLAVQMLVGLGAGILVSVIVWLGGWKYLNLGRPGISAIIIVPAAKLIVGITFLCIRRWRGFGGGVLMSLAFGVLIFFGACAGIFKI